MTRNETWPNRFWGSRDVPKTKREFFDAVVAPPPSGDAPEVATIRLYGPIDSWGGFWGISAKDVGGVLDALPESVSHIILRINSPGGHVFEGISIMNLLGAHRAKVTAVVDGLAASAASVIAAGADETVMSPGTQMMIHCTSTIVWGNAADMRKEAAVLEGLDRSLAEIYTAKAGEKDWAALLEAETWLTAADAVAEGLADRVAVIPDAGETETVGDEDDLLVVPDEDEPEDMAAARVIRFAARATRTAAKAATKLPSSTEPGDPNRKESAVAYSDLTAGLRERLGVTDADASDETLLAALDQVLEEQAENPAAPAASIPEGAVVMDAAALAELRENAALGAQARREQESTRRDNIVDAALAEGRIAASSRESWRAQLDKDEEGITALLQSFPKNAVPVAEIGHSDTVTSADDALYGSVYGSTEKEA
ncbi:head maturation protease, ClpP-related [Microbacterium stercoris]|uniref:ATP-dependent Clp protease proteolytic subunit n=1 Tax=Microbacterium stercoris TaxID=2820289 RepID=A0A939QQP8_9MICO|nr:head maturation protease, ClpP-related [Microbacterium stercoris]MBO3663726.1 ATP-dependent Clp protease proteolytic subunit [Microbacterium stercoris]